MRRLFYSLWFPGDLQSGGGDELHYKFIFLSRIFLIYILVAIGITIYRWHANILIDAINIGAITLSCLLLYVLHGHKKQIELISSIAVAFAFIACMAIYLVALDNRLRLALFYPLVAFIFYLKGRHIGLIWLVITLCSILVIEHFSGINTGYARNEIVVSAAYLIMMYFILWNYELLNDDYQRRNKEFELQLLLSERWKLALESAGDAIWDCNIPDNHIKYSSSFFDMLGYADAEFGDGVETLFTLMHPDDRYIARDKLQEYQKGDIPGQLALEFRLRCKGGDYKWVLCRGRITERDAEGKPIRLLGTCADITDSKKTDGALKLSELRLRHIIETEPECVKVVNGKGELEEMNAAGLAMLEAASLEEAKQKGLLDYIDQAYQAAFLSLHGQVMNGESGSLEFKIKGLRGTERWLETHATPMRDADGKVTSLLGVTRDVTERKRAEEAEKRLTRANRLLSRCSRALAHAEKEQELLARICQLTVEAGGYLMAWVGFAENDEAKTVHPVAQSGYEEGYLNHISISWEDNEHGRGPVGKAIRTGLTTVIQELHSNSQMAPWRDAAMQRGYQSCISLPLIMNMQKLGALTIYSTEPNAFAAEEVELLEELANELTYGIQTLRTRAENERAQLALKRESEKNLALLRNASDGIHILDYDGNVIEASESFCELLGYPREEIIGMNVFEWDVGFADAEVLLGALRRQFESPVRSQFETRHRRKNGTIFDVEVSGFPLELDGKPALFNSSRDITERKLHEKEIIQNEQQLLEILNLSPIAVRIATKKGREVVFNNPKYAGLIRNIDAIGEDPRKYYARTEDYDEILAELAQGHSVINRQVELNIPDDTMVWALASYMPMQYRGEEAVLGWFYDITERIKAETENRIAATAFESQEGMIITDAENRILRVNRAFTEITGYSGDEVIGKNPRLLNSGLQDAAFYADMWRKINEVGTWSGEIWNKRKDGVIYPEHLSITAVKNASDKVVNFVASIMDITQRKKSEENIQRLAFYDYLTELPNRRLLLDRLKQAISSSARSRRLGALLFIDLDNFKTLNDTLGHAMGDLLLLQVTSRLTKCVREGDTVARLGGDEFVIVLEELSEQTVAAAEQAEAVGTKILAALRQPFQLVTNEYSCTSSIGLTMFDGEDPEIEDLLKQADIAMYQAKKDGRNVLRFFDPKMQEAIKLRAILESELRSALEKQQLQLHFQIQVDSLGKPFGAEVLIRWIHPERGVVSPVEFIPLAEETGLILQIGHWVLETACYQLKRWAAHEHTRYLVLAVNVSAKQFRQADFASQVEDVVMRHGINPKLLKLELTESLLVENIDETISIMNSLNDVGVQLALDDFGTGYSSLQYLKRLPLDQLKIDQTFVRDLVIDKNDKAIVRTIIAMADSMYLDVIAEGVETEDQRQFLLESGCNHFQGYLFGKPVPISELEELLKGT